VFRRSQHQGITAQGQLGQGPDQQTLSLGAAGVGIHRTGMVQGVLALESAEVIGGSSFRRAIGMVVRYVKGIEDAQPILLRNTRQVAAHSLAVGRLKMVIGLTIPDLRQLQPQSRQQFAALQHLGRLDPLELRRRGAVPTHLPDLHRPLLRNQQPAQPGAIG
jgi:hypothetical protein